MLGRTPYGTRSFSGTAGGAPRIGLAGWGPRL